MKRLTALALAAALLLSLSSCGNTGNTGLKDLIDQTQSGASSEPVSSSGEQSGSKKPAPTSSKQESDDTQSASGETQETGEYERFALLEGVYRLDSGEENPEFEEVLQIYAFGDVLLLEYGGCMPGQYENPMYVSMDEFWPDPETTPEAEPLCAMGLSQGYSSSYSLTAYSSGAKECWTAVKENGVVLSRGEDPAKEYVLDSSLTGLHPQTEELLAQLKQQVSDPQQSEDVVGQWTKHTEEYVSLLSFEEDGSMIYFYQEKHKPAKAFTGAWVYDGRSKQIQCLGEWIGESNDLGPVTLSLSCAVEGDALSASDLYGDVFIQPENDFSRCSEAFTSGFSTDALLCRIGEGALLEGTYTDADGKQQKYSYCLPFIYDADGFPELLAINEDIDQYFGQAAWDDTANAENGGEVFHTEINYITGEWNGIQSLMIWSRTIQDRTFVAAYNYDVNTNKRLSTAEVVKRLGLSEKEFLDALQAAAETFFMEENAGHADDTRYDEALNWTLSSEAVNMDRPVFVDDNGELAVAACIGSLADEDYWNYQADWYYQILYPFSGAAG